MGNAQSHSTSPRKLIPAKNPQDARTDTCRLIPSTTFARGTTIGRISAAGPTQGLCKAYADGNTDGSETAIGLLMHDCITDADGQIYLAGVAGGPMNPPYDEVEYYYAGEFLAADLVGWDADALADLGGRNLLGGVVRLP